MGAVNEILMLMMLDAATHLTSPINEESLVNICISCTLFHIVKQIKVGWEAYTISEDNHIFQLQHLSSC